MKTTVATSTFVYMSVIDDKTVLVKLADAVVPFNFFDRSGELMEGKTDKVKMPLSVLLGVMCNDARFKEFYKTASLKISTTEKLELISRLLTDAKLEITNEYHEAGETYTKFGVELTCESDGVLTSISNVDIKSVAANKFLDKFVPKSDDDFFVDLLSKM